MQYIEVYTPGGLYFIDYELIDRIIYDSAYFESKYANRKKVTTDEGIGLPETYHLEINYSRAKADAKQAVQMHHVLRKLITTVRENWEQRSISMSQAEVEGLREWLFEREQRGRAAKNKLLEEQKSLSRSSMRNIKSSVHGWEAATTVARIVRDASGDILLLTAGALSGGTALALAGGGSVLKGVGKWEDSGSVAAGLLQTSVSFLTVFFPGGEAVKEYGAGAVTFVVFAKVKTEFAGNFAVALAEGKEVAEALVSAGVDTGLGALAHGVHGPFVPEAELKALLAHGIKQTPVPVDVTLKLIGAGGASALISGEATKDAVTQQVMAAARQQKNLRGRQELTRDVAICDPVLVDLAILGPDRNTPGRNW
jgi:hypothetical protein